MVAPGSAFWISPGGEIISVETTHIAEVIKTPELFGLTLAEMRDAYIRHEEPMGFEGNARAELMRQAFSRGWIRIRHRLRTGWTVELEELTSPVRAQLANWARMVLDTQPYPDDVRVTELGGNRTTVLEMTAVAELGTVATQTIPSTHL
jgi:hypothetical protein